MKVKCVIFDMDGLMFDSERIVGECLKKAAKENGYVISDELRLMLLGGSKAANKKILKTYLGNEFPYDKIMTLTKQYRQEYIENYGMPKKTGLDELLIFLKSNNILTAVASSSNIELIRYYLNITNVNKYFDYIIGGNQISESKPNPEIFLKVCKYFNIAPQEALVLEDSNNGVLAAYNGNIPVICIPDLTRPNHQTKPLIMAEVKSLYDVIDILLKKS